MPWKISSLTGERLRFVRTALKQAQPLGQLCRKFGISRKTAYKWLARFYQRGRLGLHNRPRRPRRSPRRLAPRWIKAIGRWRRRHRHWGAKKIRAALQLQHPRTQLPSVVTIARWIGRLRLSKPRAPRTRPGPTLPCLEFTAARVPNQVWTVDFKGWFRTLDGTRVEPLTVRDLCSRYVLGIYLLAHQSERAVRAAFIGLFGGYGLPQVIRVDNGAPFGGKGALGLSRLTVWWLRLGIGVQFIRPARPGENAGHEQTHGVLQAETAQPPAAHLKAQQRRTDRWVHYYNHQRPHEALGQTLPANWYQKSPRVYPELLPSWRYPRSFLTRRVRNRGSIKWQGRLRFVGRAFAGETVGLKALCAGVQEVYLGPHVIGQMPVCDPGGMRPVRRRLCKPPPPQV